MKNLAKLIALSLFLLPICVRAQEIGFSIQDNLITWFELANPALQGDINLTGLAPSFNGNALAYDPTLNRLLFVNSDDTGNRTLYSANLATETYTPGVNITVTPTPMSLTYNNPNAQPGYFGADFYNGSYYALEQGTNNLVKVNFNANGTINTTGGFGAHPLQLPPNNQNAPSEFLGDISFKLGPGGVTDLYVSGDGVNQIPTAANARLWHYTTTDGTTFAQAADNPIVPGQLRYNGMFFSPVSGTLYGYRLTTDDFGTVNPATGAFTSDGYTGKPFEGGGDLAPGPVVPEPSTLGLLGFGALLLTGAIRRSRSR